MLVKLGVTLVTLLVIALAVALLVFCPWWALLGFLLLLVVWLALSRTGRQTWSVTQVGLATIPQRLGAASVVILGIAGVVGVLIAILAMALGFEATLRQTGDDSTAIVLRAGSLTELNSGITHETAELVAQQP
jgi:putative ABC transport system permease protein